MKEKEYLAVVDDKNISTGEVYDRDFIHKNNLYHREVAVWVINENNEILIQKRASDKERHPGLWSVIAGHVNAGELTYRAAIREAFEEMGILIEAKDLKFITATKMEFEGNKKFAYEYYCHTNLSLSDYIIQESEVCDLAYISLEDIINDNYPNGEESIFTTSPNKEIYILHLKKILNK